MPSLSPYSEIPACPQSFLALGPISINLLDFCTLPLWPSPVSHIYKSTTANLASASWDQSLVILSRNRWFSTTRSPFQTCLYLLHSLVLVLTYWSKNLLVLSDNALKGSLKEYQVENRVQDDLLTHFQYIRPFSQLKGSWGFPCGCVMFNAFQTHRPWPPRRLASRYMRLIPPTNLHHCHH